MEVIRLNKDNMQEAAARAVEVIRAGGIILYPTDTLYGLGADALSDRAVQKIFNIKSRSDSKPIHAIVSDLRMVARYAGANDESRSLIEKLPKGKATFIVPKKNGFDTGMCKGIPTFGFRIPDNEFCVALLQQFGGPITATSANVSGAPSGRRVSDILAQLGGKADNIDLVVDAGELPESKPSTVLDLSGDQLNILREGAIPTSEILATLRS